MHDKNDNIANHANSLPTILLGVGVTLTNRMRIIENKLGGFKT